MQFDSDQIAAIIGAKELELIALRMQVAQLQAKVEELTPKTEEPLKVD